MPSTIRDLRRAAGWTQEELGQRAGLSRTLVCNLERGYVPKRLDAHEAVAAALDVPLEAVTNPTL